MNKLTKILNILWYGVKIILHLTDKKDTVDKMDNIEKEFKK
ncbi:MAG: hypothetical protein ACRDA4_08460 [Filifactoraceae bacterium]